MARQETLICNAGDERRVLQVGVGAGAQQDGQRAALPLRGLQRRQRRAQERQRHHGRPLQAASRQDHVSATIIVFARDSAIHI